MIFHRSFRELQVQSEVAWKLNRDQQIDQVERRHFRRRPAEGQWTAWKLLMELASQRGPLKVQVVKLAAQRGPLKVQVVDQPRLGLQLSLYGR